MNLNVCMINLASIRTVAASASRRIDRTGKAATVVNGRMIVKCNRLMCESVVIEWRIQ